MITLRNHAPRSHMIGLPMTLGVLDMIIVYDLQLDDVPGADSKIHCTPSANQKSDGDYNV